MPKTRLVPLLIAALVAGAAVTALLATAQAAAPLAPNAVTAVQYAEGLTNPVDIAHSGLPNDERLFVVERRGRIKIVPPGGGVVSPTAFLSITDRVTDAGGEQGLLGLAFSPNYAADKHFFVYYVDTAGDLQLSRFSVSPDDPDVALTAETKLLTIPHPVAPNHNGGDLAFGPDGFLYLAPGDGGNTPWNAQDLTSLLGKVLRLDVTGALTYTVPLTNPYYGGGGRAEIWAYGLRNPFRFSFDRLTGDLYIGDVGQDHWEEINFQPAASTGGENYGWRCFEGTHPLVPDDCDPLPPNLVMPVAEYCNGRATGCNDGGRAVVAGNVYRGSAYPGLYGTFFYADNASGRFWAMRPGTWQVVLLPIGNVPNPSSFGEDLNGELYVSSLTNGNLYRLTGTSPFFVETPFYLPVLRR